MQLVVQVIMAIVSIIKAFMYCTIVAKNSDIRIHYSNIVSHFFLF